MFSLSKVGKLAEHMKQLHKLVVINNNTNFTFSVFSSELLLIVTHFFHIYLILLKENDAVLFCL